MNDTTGKPLAAVTGASNGVEELMAGKDHIVAGSMKTKAQVAAGRIMPETAKAATQARQTAPGSGS